MRHGRSEEHTSELQSLRHLVCRLLLEKKKKEGRSADCPGRDASERHPQLVHLPEGVPLPSRAIYSPFFFFNDTGTTEIYTLSLHDALPISCGTCVVKKVRISSRKASSSGDSCNRIRSEEHTSELQSLRHLVCRLLLEK